MWIQTENGELVNTNHISIIRKNWEGKGTPERWYVEAVTQREYPGIIRVINVDTEDEADNCVRRLYCKIKRHEGELKC